jgi:hypothetical protein
MFLALTSPPGGPFGLPLPHSQHAVILDNPCIQPQTRNKLISCSHDAEFVQAGTFFFAKSMKGILIVCYDLKGKLRSQRKAKSKLVKHKEYRVLLHYL